MKTSGNKKVNSSKLYTGERAEFGACSAVYKKCMFTDGESPLKESRDVELYDCVFGWKYPLWYTKSALVVNAHWQKTARSGVWYTDDVTLRDCIVDAPKNFRRCNNVDIRDTVFSDAIETMWGCVGVNLERVRVCGDYFGMNCDKVTARDLTIDGNYCFDGAKNIEIVGATLNSKDSFWNTENVVVKDSTVIGEYIGWNSKNLTFINCRIQSEQGFCYIDGLKLENCDISGTTLCFEYCKDVCANLVGRVDSVKNPVSGFIEADEFGEIVVENDKINPADTKISVRKKS